ncbi:hypothetical protein QBC34DRAFT_153551 [Podospora aff. communis PSN243]|uniref:Uncharacterized protein n=1 Tax=Podospora aff. communis PSN243 TaxID=3040156 RepID=A0AAV9GAL2_9PEZI|nr:hypothetical protein QBC34DRAFT_153551 [Podospora aff. communis PSN243]
MHVPKATCAPASRQRSPPPNSKPFAMLDEELVLHALAGLRRAQTKNRRRSPVALPSHSQTGSLKRWGPDEDPSVEPDLQPVRIPSLSFCDRDSADRSQRFVILCHGRASHPSPALPKRLLSPTAQKTCRTIRTTWKEIVTCQESPRSLLLTSDCWPSMRRPHDAARTVPWHGHRGRRRAGEYLLTQHAEIADCNLVTALRRSSSRTHRQSPVTRSMHTCIPDSLRIPR